MDYYLGEIRLFAGDYATDGWHICDGSSLPINGNEALYSLIGTTYGGNATSFNLPDLRGKLPVGTGVISGGTNNYVLGQGGGVTEVTLTEATTPAHTHNFNVSTADATTGSPINGFLASTNGNNSTLQPPYPNVKLYMPLPTGVTQPNTTLDADAASYNFDGETQPHNNLMPYLCINYIIAITGLFPNPQ